MTGEDIERATLQHFEKLLSFVVGSDIGSRDLMLEVINEEVSREDNKASMLPFSVEEVKKAIFSLHPNKVPGPNGFIVEVFQKCWEFMGEDIWRVVEDFKKKRRFVKEINNIINPYSKKIEL